MTNTTPAEEVLKSDVLGRVKTPRARQEVLLDEFERSGVSGKKFAALVGINYQTFATWVQRRRRTHGKYPLRAKPRTVPAGKAAEPLRLFEAVLANAATAAVGEPLRVSLPGGGWVEVGDARQAALAAELLRALAARSC
jgi:hypothetical protein